jgi:hypothetical protein
MVGEFAAVVALVLSVPIVQVLVLSPLVMMAVGIGLGAWNVVYGVRAVRHMRRFAPESTPPAAPSTPPTVDPAVVEMGQ